MFQDGQRCDLDRDHKEGSDTIGMTEPVRSRVATILFHNFRKFRNFELRCKGEQECSKSLCLRPEVFKLLARNICVTFAPKLLARAVCICQSPCQLARNSQHERYFEIPLEMSRPLARAYCVLLVSMCSVRHY